MDRPFHVAICSLGHLNLEATLLGHLENRYKNLDSQITLATLGLSDGCSGDLGDPPDDPGHQTILITRRFWPPDNPGHQTILATR